MTSTSTEQLIGPLLFHALPDETTGYYTLCGRPLETGTVLELRVAPHKWIHVRFCFSGDSDSFPLFEIPLPDTEPLAVLRVPGGAVFRLPFKAEATSRGTA